LPISEAYIYKPLEWVTNNTNDPIGDTMTKQQQRIKAQNLVLLATKYNLSTGEALELQKTAKSLHRLNENACNYGGLTDRQETRQHNLFTKAKEIIGVYIREQRDPRGWPLEISTEPMTDSQTYDYVCPF
jgi:hypothetical protein